MTTQLETLLEIFSDHVFDCNESALEGYEQDFVEFMETEPILGEKSTIHHYSDFEGYTQFDTWISFGKRLEDWIEWLDSELDIDSMLRACLTVVESWIVCNSDTVGCINNCVFIGNPSLLLFQDYDAKLLEYLNNQELSITVRSCAITKDSNGRERINVRVVFTNSRGQSINYVYYDYKALREGRNPKFKTLIKAVLGSVFEEERYLIEYITSRIEIDIEQSTNPYEREFRLHDTITECINSIRFQDFMHHSFTIKDFKEQFYEYLLHEENN